MADSFCCTNDWQTAFVAPLYWDLYAPKGLNSARVCFICHNFEYQGTAPASELASCGLDVSQLNRPDRMQDHSSHDSVNPVKHQTCSSSNPSLSLVALHRSGKSIVQSDDVGQIYLLNTGQGECQKDAKYDQERLALKEAGVELGPAVLYFGCMNRKLANE